MVPPFKKQLSHLLKKSVHDFRYLHFNKRFTSLCTTSKLLIKSGNSWIMFLSKHFLISGDLSVSFTSAYCNRWQCPRMLMPVNLLTSSRVTQTKCTRELTSQYLGWTIFTSYYSAAGFFYDYPCQELILILITTPITTILSSRHFPSSITGKNLKSTCTVCPRTQKWQILSGGLFYKTGNYYQGKLINFSIVRVS